jgi:hypothetical protein
MRYKLVFVITVIIMAAAGSAYPRSGDRLKGNVSIEALSEGRSAFLSIPHQDFWKGETRVTKKYLEARRGENYSIFIRNSSPERIGVVVAVDGRNIISGKKSSLANNEDMYIVNGYEHGRYEGWRTANDKVHKFYFTDVADSYAVRTFDDSTAMGLIAVAIYLEKERPKALLERKMQDKAARAPAAESSGKGGAAGLGYDAAGTGFGGEQYSPTVRVAFEPESGPVQKTLLKYEWREALCTKGILNCGGKPGSRLWDEGAYAPYPPGYCRN